MKDDHRYDALRNADTHSESSTEVEDVDAEQAIRPRRHRRARNPSLLKRLKSHWWMVDTALLLVIFGLVAERKWKPHHSHTYEFAGDISGFAPTCELPSGVVRESNG